MWTEEQLTLLERYIVQDGFTYAKTAELLGRSRCAVAGAVSRLREHKPIPRKDTPWPAERTATLKRLLEGGLTYQQIADHFGVSRRAVHNKAWRMGFVKTRRPKIAPTRKEPGHSLVVINAEVAAQRGLHPDTLRLRTKNRYIVNARHECFYRARRELGASLYRIARFYNLTHKAVLYGAQKWERRA